MNIRNPYFGTWACGWVVLLGAGCATTGVPDQALRLNDQGAQALAEGDLDRAEASFRVALEYQPAYAESRSNLGVVALERGDCVGAERELRAALRVDPEFAQAWGNLGVVFERTERAGEAKAAYQKAVALDPGLIAARRSLAHLQVHAGEFSEARSQAFRLLQVVPGDVDAMAVIAACEAEMGRPLAALEWTDRVLEEDADHVLAHWVRAVVGMSVRQGIPGVDVVDSLTFVARAPEYETQGIQALHAYGQRVRGGRPQEYSRVRTALAGFGQ